MTGFATAKAAIRAYIESNWTATPIAWQNGPFTRPVRPETDPLKGEPLPWLYVEIISTGSSGSQFGSTGKRVKADSGLVIGHVFVPIGSDDIDANDTATEFGEMLQLRSIGPAPAPRLESPTIGGGDSGDDDGVYYGVSVTVPFRISYTA
jgi:hypothetical protein